LLLLPQAQAPGATMPATHLIQTKRAYDPPNERDGRRILVDRLWPRGVSKERAALDGWLKEVAPSTELRRWFGHDPARWDEFVRRYKAELAAPEQQAALATLAGYAAAGPLTLIYAAKDTTHNEAAVLADLLQQRLRHSAAGE
jgi:uncharacterized protein YeaO (DUF488 family)